MSRRRRLHRAVTWVLSLTLIAIGLALVASTLASGGGAIARGVVMGALFVAAGALRLYLQSATRDG